MCICGDPDCKVYYGMCHCGCGDLAPIAKQTVPSRRWIKGQPTICCLGHGRTSQPRPPIEQPDDLSIRHLPLSHGLYAIVDAGWYEWLMRWRWFAAYDDKMGGYYAKRRCRPRDIFRNTSHLSMHSYLFPVPDGFVVDHENHNTLDNRICNLRQATPRENGRNQRVRKSNTTGITGVHAAKTRSGETMYVARAVIDGKRVVLGWRKLLDDAAKLRRDAELRHYGRFAPKK